MAQTLSKEIIAAAIAGFEAQKEQINSRIAELREMLDGQPATLTAEAKGSHQPKRAVSAASRRRMALAQKKRWAGIKAQSPSGSETSAERPKRRISPEGMKRIIEATKKRWALKRAEEAKANKKPAKEGPRVQRKAGTKKAAPAKAA